MHLLLIAKNWPEPNSTAAGRRTLSLLDLLAQAGYQIHIASAAEPTPFQAPLETLGYSSHRIAINSSSFDDWLVTLKPDLVIFDRFVTEEQFGWRINTLLPHATTILDTSDLHCLRLAREKAFKQNSAIELNNETAVREVSSILRCDLTLMISKVEIELLINHFSVPPQQLYYLPFLITESDTIQSKPYQQREHLVVFGGFKHSPNKDAVHWLKQSLWPELKKHLPKQVELHIYGAYADHAINQLHNPSERFFIKGRAENALDSMNNYRVNLAPLRFGAGQKGKILDGWLSGTPTITTPIGAEAMAEADELGYWPSNEPVEFSKQVSQAYLDIEHWQDLQQRGQKILDNQFHLNLHANAFKQYLATITADTDNHRQPLFLRQLIWQNQLRASEYMSRWIELKNRISNE